jgi:CO/xanthine dehydrogenase FAD-binding subunit
MAAHILARSLEEALVHLQSQPLKTRILAGGTDVMIDLRSARLDGDRLPELLLDVTAIPELKTISVGEEGGQIGAAVSFREIETHPQIRKHWPLLAGAVSRIGSLQVRHLGTLGGNVGTASPAGDAVTPLVCLSAEALIRSSKGSRTVPVSELITGPGKISLAEDELIVAFLLNPPAQPKACFFDKIMRRQAVAIARMNLAVQLALDETGKIVTVQIAAGAVLPRPRRLEEVERLLLGRKAEEKLFAQAGEAAVQVMLAVSGNRPSMVYKAPALKRLVAWGVGRAAETASSA